MAVKTNTFLGWIQLGLSSGLPFFSYGLIHIVEWDANDVQGCKGIDHRGRCSLGQCV